MSRQRHLAVLIALVSLSGLLGTGRALSQTPQPPTVEDRDRAIDLYKQGDRVKAINILSEFSRTHSEDADAWYFLALAYYGGERSAPRVPPFSTCSPCVPIQPMQMPSWPTP
jgi:hypothetical protein